MLKVVEKQDAREAGGQLFELDEIARMGARRMLMAALGAEADDYVERHREERDETGRALVVHNGRAQGRKLTLGAGTVELRAPRVNDRRRDEQGQRQRFTSHILPPYMRRSPKVAEVLPILYLRGLSTGDFRPALEGLLGEDAAGLSPTNIARLTTCWEKEYTAFRQRSLEGREYVYVWVDGVHFNIRLEDDRLCTLVMIGARPNGEKELIAVEDGYRESAESWKALLRDLKRRGMAAPALAVGDGALGFWAALREVWPKTREQACWCHKLGNVLDKLPQRLQPRAKRALHEMMYAECRVDCEAARSRFEAEYQPKYPKAVASLTANWERLVTFFDFPAAPERRGSNSISRTGLRVAGEKSLGFWRDRLKQAGGHTGDVSEVDGRLTLPFEDKEGQRLVLVDDGGAGSASPWERSPVARSTIRRVA